jgi:hypothetical protein
MEKPLSLSEKIYLLAIHPVKGGIIMSAGSAINYVIAGALLIELQKKGSISFTDKRFVVKNRFPDLQVHRNVLSKVKHPERPQRITSYISKLSYSRKDTIFKIREMLVDKGIIRLKERQFLYIFRWKVAEIVKKNVVEGIIEDLGKQVLMSARDEESVLLLSLILPANLQRRVFPEKQKRLQALPILKELTENNIVSKLVFRVIRAARAATAAAAT